MDTFKIFQNTYKPWQYMELMPLGFFLFLTIMQAIAPTQLHNGINNLYWLIYFFFFMPLSNITYKLFDKKPLYLLPTSRRTKFFMPLGIAFITIIFALFLTIPIEAIVHIFTIGKAAEEQIAIGGFLKFGVTHNSAIFISFVINCVFVFIHTLIRNKIVMMSLSFVLSFGILLYTPKVAEFLMLSPALSTNAIIGCLASSILLIAASYQLFKHWQPANDGIFRV